MTGLRVSIICRSANLGKSANARTSVVDCIDRRREAIWRVVWQSWITSSTPILTNFSFRLVSGQFSIGSGFVSVRRNLPTLQVLFPAMLLAVFGRGFPADVLAQHLAGATASDVAPFGPVLSASPSASSRRWECRDMLRASPP